MLIALSLFITVCLTTSFGQSPADYCCDNAGSAFKRNSASIQINTLCEINEKCHIPVFELSQERYHVWGAAVLHYCHDHVLTSIECFEVYNACKLKIQSMGESVYSRSLKQPSTHRTPVNRDLSLSDQLHIVDQKVAIIGANGYVGSNLHEHLLPVHRVTGYDRYHLPYNQLQPVILQSSGDISEEELQTYDVVVHLGGFTGRKDCLAHSAAEVFRENIWDPVYLARRMNSSQMLLFASTSAVSEGSGSREHREDSAIGIRHLDEYSLSMYEREVILDQFSASHALYYGREAPKLVGLRFGSVVGYSKSQRLNLAFMAMLRSAYSSVSGAHIISF
jgi:hypothetical protein